MLEERFPEIFLTFDPQWNIGTASKVYGKRRGQPRKRSITKEMEGSRSERNDGNEKGAEKNGRGRKRREWKQRRKGNEIKGRERKGKRKRE
jgi:hypothetical protein